MPVRVQDAELAEGLVAGDHGATQSPAGRLAEEAREDVEEQPADVGEEVPIVPEEDAQYLGNDPDELRWGRVSSRSSLRYTPNRRVRFWAHEGQRR
jgi:hypothetical protein